MNLKADLVLELKVEIGKAQEVGKTPRGLLRLIPIIGGEFSGKNIKGKVLAGGYDWNTVINDNIVHLYAKYAILTDDNEIISVENEGYIDNRTQNIIKTVPRFQVSDGKYDWLQSGVFVGSLEFKDSDTNNVYIKFYKME